jgi:NAD(P)-dependent dehydrogenase (short-subunit alcohol dehydrogenase family)
MELNMKTVVITGSSRGIGLGMAKEFLNRGHQVIISGTSETTVSRALDSIKIMKDNVIGVPCMVQDIDSVKNLWQKGFDRFGKIDIWINNAGVSTSRVGIENLELDEILTTINTNLTGSILCTKVVAKEMLKQGYGQIYMFEGFGSNGQLQKGISVYGSTKRALRYFTAAAANEYKDTPIIIGSISPGIVATDLLVRSSKGSGDNWEKAKKILNVLADRVEVVTPWLVEQTLKNNKNGAQIAWLTKTKVIGRLLFGRLFCKKTTVDDWEAEMKQ